METAYILMDIGGTEIKCGISGEDGHIVLQTKFPADAGADKETILTNFAGIIKKLMALAKCRIGGIGMAFPGPFDYERGISLMRGLDKYDSIYGIPLAEAVKERAAQVRDVPFTFLHDVEAFAVGESRFGPAKAAGKIFCLCIGTGAGSAFVEDKQALKHDERVPLNGWIYSTPFKETIIDDYISVRGLRSVSERILGRSLNGKQLYALCTEGDAQAKEVYEIFGRNIAAAAEPFIKSFGPDALVLGGQISGSFEFFGGALTQVCQKYGTRLYLEKDTSVRAMQGLFSVMKGGDCYAES